jgi:Endomembrane protein 70
MADDQIHWFSIVNSLMIVLFLSGMVAMIMMRTLHRDISQYNQLETAEEAQEETGWKLVRAPPVSLLADMQAAARPELPGHAALSWGVACALQHCRRVHTRRKWLQQFQTPVPCRCTATCCGRRSGQGCCRCTSAPARS